MKDIAENAGTWSAAEQLEIAARVRQAEQYAVNLTEKLEALLRENMLLREQA